MKVDAGSELGEPIANEVVADVRAAEVYARIGGFCLVSLARELERGLRYLRFAAVGPAGNKRDALR